MKYTMKKGIKRSRYWPLMVDLLEKYFPKNRCKERGQAIFLICEIEKMLQERVRSRGNPPRGQRINEKRENR